MGVPYPTNKWYQRNSTIFSSILAQVVLTKSPNKTNLQLSTLEINLKIQFFIEPVSAPERDDILKTLKKCAPGYDEINIDILNLCLPCIKHLLLLILNFSLLHGVFPNELKIANVLQLFKSDDPMECKNYRPVSLLSILTTILEKSMYSRLSNFLEMHKILYEKQFGFRKKNIQHIWHIWLLMIT